MLTLGLAVEASGYVTNILDFRRASVSGRPLALQKGSVLERHAKSGTGLTVALLVAVVTLDDQRGLDGMNEGAGTAFYAIGTPVLIAA